MKRTTACYRKKKKIIKRKKENWQSPRRAHSRRTRGRNPGPRGRKSAREVVCSIHLSPSYAHKSPDRNSKCAAHTFLRLAGEAHTAMELSSRLHICYEFVARAPADSGERWRGSPTSSFTNIIRFARTSEGRPMRESVPARAV